MLSSLVINKLSPAKCVYPVVSSQLSLVPCRAPTCRDTINMTLLQSCVCVSVCVCGCSSTIRSSAGLRLVELRKGSVCHHWEFVADNGPTEFIVNIDEVRHLVVENDTEVVVVAQDDSGAILKCKLLPHCLRV